MNLHGKIETSSFYQSKVESVHFEFITEISLLLKATIFVLKKFVAEVSLHTNSGAVVP